MDKTCQYLELEFKTNYCNLYGKKSNCTNCSNFKKTTSSLLSENELKAIHLLKIKKSIKTKF